MRYAFRVKSTFAAEVTLDLDKQRIVKEVVTEAEKLDLRQGESAIFHVDVTSLKAVVDFDARSIHFMTCEEYDKAGLPPCPHHGHSGGG